MHAIANMLTALILALVTTTAGALAEKPMFTARDVFNLEWASDPQVAPDGSLIVYARTGFDILTDRPRASLWTVNPQSGLQAPLVTGPGSYSAPRFSPDGTRLLYTASEGGTVSLNIVHMDDGRAFSLGYFANPPGEAVWSPDGSQIAFTMFTPEEGLSLAKPVSAPKGADWAAPVKVFDTVVIRRDGRGEAKPGASQLYVIPSTGGAPRQITKLKFGLSGPQWLDADTLLASANLDERAELDPIESNIVRVELGDGSVTNVTTLDGPEGSVLVNPRGNGIAFLGYTDKVLSYQQTELTLADADGGNARVVTANFDRSISDIAWHPNGRDVLALVEDEGDNTLVHIHPEGTMRTLTRAVGGTSIGRPYASGAYSAGGRASDPVIAFTHADPYRPADLAVWRRGKVEVLTDLNRDALGHLALARIEEVNVPSSFDGRNIQAWVAYPPGHEADGTAPMIMEIHGGPYAMYGPTFAAEIQRFAAEGYVTVYVNPRGSTGYGEAFAQLIDKNYPGEDYDDLISVVDHLVERGDVSPDRLFVTGGSGGGVLTAWIIGKTDRFAAAGVIKPVINWATMALSADIAAYVRRHWIREDPWTVEGRAEYWRTSPLSLVGNVSTPTLVMVGEEDWRTPPWEAEQYYTALKLREVEAALVRVPGASHSIAARPSHLNAKVDNIMGWFALHDPARTQQE